jgi:hypothetical protein
LSELAVDDSVKAALDRSCPFYIITHLLDSRIHPSFSPDLVDQRSRLCQKPEKSNLSSASAAPTSILPYTPVLPAPLPIQTDVTAHLSRFTFPTLDLRI